MCAVYLMMFSRVWMKVKAVDNSRVRNWAVLIVLILVYAIPTFIISWLSPEPVKLTLDIFSVLMIAFGIVGLWLVSEETWAAFWAGERDRTALALYGLFTLFLSVILMRSYGVATRRNESLDAYLSSTYIYSALVYVQMAGLWLFSRASTPPSLPSKKSRWGQFALGILIGVLLASSRAIEPVLMALGRIWSRLF